MIDSRVVRILELSDEGVEKRARVSEREELFAELSGESFHAPPAQPYELANYGFGLKDKVRAVVPYCVSAYAQQPKRALLQDPKLAALLAALEPYPILAGSAVFLGVNHDMCDDVDLVTYVDVGTTEEERINVGQQFRRIVNELRPTALKASLNNEGEDKPPRGRGRREGETKIRAYLAALVGNNPRKPDPQLVARLASAQLIWTAESFGSSKPISLQIHFVHQAFIDNGIHPYQELHDCNPASFVHTNRHWLAPSLLNYFGFLELGIQKAPCKNSTTKAAKRAAMLLGIVGDHSTQKYLVTLLEDYLRLTDDPQRKRSLENMEAILNDLRIAIAEQYKL